MANLTSQLTVRLRDEVSGPAGKASRSIRDLDRAAKSAAKGSAGVGSGMRGIGSAALAVGGTTLGVYGLARGLSAAYTEAATFDRRMTRIGNTADASAAAVKEARKQVQDLAQEVALPVDDVVNGLDALVAQGRSLPEALALLPSVARTAQATGAAVDDIARSAGAVGDQFKVGADKMQLAFDMMSKGGKAGQFELKDMAKDFPSLAAQAAAIGFKGTQGLSTLVSALQMVRKNSGTAGEATTALQDVLGKMESKDTLKAFKENFGIDLERSFKKARKEGHNLFEVLEAALVKITEKDLSNVNKVFTDKEARRGALAIAQYAQERRRLDQQIQNESAGTVMSDLATVTKDAQSSVVRLGTAWNSSLQSLGRLMDAAGASTFLNTLARGAQSAADSFDEMSKNMEKGEGFLARLEKAVGAYNAGVIAQQELAGNQQREYRVPMRDAIDENKKGILDKRMAAGTAEINRAVANTAGMEDSFFSRHNPAKIADRRSIVRALDENVSTVAASIALQAAAIRRQANAYPWAGDDSEARGAAPQRQSGPAPGPYDFAGRQPLTAGMPQLPFDRFEPVERRPLMSRIDPKATALNTEGLDAAKTKAIEAGQAIQALGATVAPGVDVSALDLAQAKADRLLATIQQIGPAMQGAGSGISSRSFGIQFEHRRNGSFADWEHW